MIVMLVNRVLHPLALECLQEQHVVADQKRLDGELTGFSITPSTAVMYSSGTDAPLLKNTPDGVSMRSFPAGFIA